MKRWTTISVVLAAAGMVAFGCNDNSKEAKESAKPVAQAAQPAQTATSAPASAPAPTTNPASTAAEIRGKKLTYGDVVGIKHQLGERIPDQDVIDLWKRSVVLSDEFDRSGFEKDQEITLALELMTMRMKGEMYVFLKRMHAEVTDADIQKAYDDQAKMPTSELREADKVTVKFVTQKEKADAEKLKSSIKDRAEFDTLVAGKADETKKLMGISSATLENVTTDSLRPSLGVQAYALSRATLNEIKGPVKVPSGWAMFMVTERTQGAMKPLDSVKDQLRNQVKQAKQSQVARDIVAAAEKEAGIERKAPQQQPGRPAMTPPAGRGVMAPRSGNGAEPNDAAKAAARAALRKAAEKAKK